MPVDTPALARLQRDLVEAERFDLERAPKRDEPLGREKVDRGRLHRRASHRRSVSHRLEAKPPAGLAAWIVEKYRAWSDCGGDIEAVFSKDELLTNITIYWATETIASSFRPYWDHGHDPNRRSWTEITVHCGIAIFPKDRTAPPREFAERSYNIQRWTEMPRGGHFAALEQPALLADDIREFFAHLPA
jgi:pimeloyl-ACP methyl ester carboxylesterase